MDVDRQARVIRSAAVDVDAPPELVWATLTDLPTWPVWNTGVKTVTADGAFVVGTTFRWKAGPGTVRSKVLDAAPGESAAWSGDTMGIKAIHVWSFAPGAAGGTHVESTESWTGLPPRLLPGPLGKTLKKALDDGVAALKAESERRARG